MAALKLYEEGSGGGVGRLAEIVGLDHRDELAWAESPEVIQAKARLGSEERNRLRECDRAQYLAWLAED